MRVLLADDDDFYRHAIRKALEDWGYEVTGVSDGTEALRILQADDRPNLAILDWMMPGMDGVNVCCRVRALNNIPYVYILLATTRDRKIDMITGLEAQADDYLVKPFDLRELKVRLQAGQRIIDLQSALASKQRELSHKATHDSLTGLWNRSAVLDILDREAGCSQRMNSPLSLALADIDHFKIINDTYGHVAGDAVLIEVTRRMQSTIRHYDTIGRYGGEEFIIVLPGLDNHRAFSMAERLRVQVAKEPYYVLEEEISVTLSIGVAVDNGTGNPGALLRTADEALYRAKARGRNHVEIFRDGENSVDKFSSRNQV
jgi:two-component system cell cycle response regulator